METKIKSVNYDVVILGAGPAGCACALTLKNSGLRVAIIDKEEFPRDKICGDAISGRAVKVLSQISSVYSDAFKAFQYKFQTRNSLVGFDGREINIKWKEDAYTCKRVDFDNFLFSLVEKYTSSKIYTGESISEIETNEMGFVLYSKDKTSKFHTTMLVGADGAQSIVKKKLAGIYPDKNHQGGAIRAYFKNVSVRDKDTTEIYMQKHFMPGYFWIFPLPDNRCNVGFGMISKQISLRKINLRKSFHEFIEASSLLKEKFKGAEIEGNLEGFSLPLGSKRIPVSGEHFLLAGDAASLIDPLTGDGIGNAMLSGRLAAKQIRKSFAKDDFSASYMKRYDNKLFKTIGRELKQRYYLQRIFHLMPSLLRWIFLIKGRKSLDSEA